MYLRRAQMMADPSALWTLTYGNAPLRVEEIRGTKRLKCTYVRSGQVITSTWDKLKPYDEESDPEKVMKKVKEEKMTANRLYCVKNPEKYGFGKEESVYGTRLTTDSAGRYVLELKGMDRVLAVPTSDLEKVLPYTFDAFFEGDTARSYSFLGTAGEVEVGDLLYSFEHGKYLHVTEVDSKSEKATKRLDGFKMNATRMDQGE